VEQNKGQEWFDTEKQQKGLAEGKFPQILMSFE